MIVWRMLRFLFWEFLAPAAVVGAVVMLVAALVAGFGQPFLETAQPLVWLNQNHYMLAIACMVFAVVRIVNRVRTGYYESGGELGKIWL
jgi:xanthine/uracil permease